MNPSKAAIEVKHRGLLTVVTMLAVIMQILDTTIANVALPSMQGNLGAAQDTINWVLTSYIVAAAIATPITGWLAEVFGRSRLFIISVLGFTAASCLCGLSGSLAEMVGYRILQGLFGAALAPLSQAVLFDINPPERHGQAMAVWGAGIMVAPILGPTLGGWLTDTFDWRWVFFINLPIGLLAAVGLILFMPVARQHRRRFDFFGFSMLGLFVGALQLMLDRGELLDWFSSPEVLIETAVAVSALWVFIVHSATSEHPFIHPQIFRNRNFVAACIFSFCISVVLLATTALLPPILQRLLGFPTVTTGLVLAPRGIGTMIAMLFVGRLMHVVDPRLLVLGGLAIAIFALNQMTGFSTDMNATPVVMTGILQGFGLGFVFVPMSTVGFATLPPELRTDAASLYSLVRNIGSSIGISLVTTMLSQNTQVNHAQLGEHLTPFSPALGAVAHALGVKVSSPTLSAMMEQLVTAQASMIAYVDDFKLMMWVTIGALPLVLLLTKPPARKGNEPAIPDAE